MSEEIQRILGDLMARVKILEENSKRNTNAWIAVGMGAVGVIVSLILREVGLL